MIKTTPIILFIYLLYLLNYYLDFNVNLYAFVFSDGKLDIVVPSFVHYLEVLEGSDGDKMAGKVSFILDWITLML